MTETKKRIEEYTNKLPKMKEKVIAAIALLVVGAAMMTTVSFAWLAMSVNPEVTGVNTAIASNGNLEIALATGSRYTAATVPGATQLGDSNKDNVERNITWGNLINLADPVYGLDNLVLRPAQLNTAKLDTSPLYGALYTPDGRLEKLDSSFGYTQWDVNKQMFVYNTDLGVRAISSVTKDFGEEMQIIYDQLSAAENKNLEAITKYEAIADNKEQMQSLATMMGLFMTAQMNPSDDELKNPDCQPEDLQNLVAMYAAFKEAMELEAEAIAMAINFQIYVTRSAASTYTAETVLSLSLSKGADFTLPNPDDPSKPIKITKLGQFLYDYNIVKNDLVNLQNLATQGSVKWSDSKLNEIVSRLTTVSKCTIGADNTPIGSIGVSNAMSYLSGTQEARINDGILWNFEERTGGYIAVKGLSISASVKRYGIKVPATVTANVQTSAPRNYNLFKQDLAYAESLFGGFDESQGTVVANDTYGLAIDLWVRSNASGGFLTLEGNVLTKSEEVDDTGVDMDGNAVKLYTLSRTDTSGEEPVTLTYTLYKLETKDDSDNVVETWYQAETHATFALEDGENPIEKKKTVITVIGYEGANRVWDGEPGAALTVNSTTQGSGSCYVFYPANSEDQARTIELLKSFKVAFVDGDGKLLAIATMNTDMRYEEPGKVIVPLQLDSSSSVYVGDDAAGNPIYAITALEKNVATRISAIVYLDGTEVENDDVLAAETIQGQMNIQFGTTADLNHAENEDLKFDEISVSAELSKTSFDFDEASASNPMTTKITLTVTGDKPNSITGYFFRELNSTQGSRDELMVFTYNESTGKWECDYTFDSPGKYIFRSVFVDGVERELSNEAHPRVEIQGFTIRSLTMSGSNQVMTADSSYTASMSLEFATSDPTKMPRAVEARFRREDGTVAVATFHRDATTQIWHANVKFTFSGTYVLSSIYLDGTEQPITGFEKNLTLYLGMYVKVYTQSPMSFKYDREAMVKDGYDKLKMQVKIFDNSGREMRALNDVRLAYSARGSAVKTLDTGLNWNSINGYYEGEFNAIEANAGIFTFSKVTVGDNVITNSATSPTFNIASPNPPQYINGSFTEINGGYQIQMKYTEAATVVGYINKVDKDGNVIKEYEITGTATSSVGEDIENAISTWTFNIPVDGNGSQDGRWQFVGAKVWNYYDIDGYHQEAPVDQNGIIIPDKDENGIPIEGVERGIPVEVNVTSSVMKIAKVPYVSFDTDKSQDLRGNAFMEPYVRNDGLSIKIVDFEGESIGATDVTLKFAYKYETSKAYGGYERKDLTNATTGATITLVLKADADGKVFTQDTDITFLYAGEYETTLSIKVGNTGYTYSDTDSNANGGKLPAKTPTFKVWSEVPTVYISDISLDGNGAYAVDLTKSGYLADTETHTVTSSGCSDDYKYTCHIDTQKHIFAGDNKNYISKIETDNLTAWLFFKCNHTSTVKDYDGGTSSNALNRGAVYIGHTYSYNNGEGVPRADLTLSGMGNASNAKLTFAKSDSGDVIMITQYTADRSGGTYWGDYSSFGTDSYEWSNDGVCKRFIGVMDNGAGKNNSDTKTVADTITADTLVLTHDGVEYSFNIPTITIHNPY